MYGREVVVRLLFTLWERVSNFLQNRHITPTTDACFEWQCSNMVAMRDVIDDVIMIVDSAYYTYLSVLFLF